MGYARPAAEAEDVPVVSLVVATWLPGLASTGGTAQASASPLIDIDMWVIVRWDPYVSIC